VVKGDEVLGDAPAFGLVGAEDGAAGELLDDAGDFPAEVVGWVAVLVGEIGNVYGR
jgi:hypothetical protein